MNNNIRSFSARRVVVDSILINKVLVNTYLLLSSTIFFSAVMAFISIKSFVKPIGFLPMFVIYMFLLFCIEYFKKTLFSLFFVFALTGFSG